MPLPSTVNKGEKEEVPIITDAVVVEDEETGASPMLATVAVVEAQSPTKSAAVATYQPPRAPSANLAQLGRYRTQAIAAFDVSN